MKKLIEEIEGGGSFWEVVWRRFIDRDIKREEVKEVIRRYYVESDGNYKEAIKKMNIDESDYKKLISLFHKYDLKV